MNHFFENVFGWFNYEDKLAYDKAVNTFNDGDIFVEVGSFKGRSACAMAVNIINSKKDIKFYCVDTWNGSGEEHKNDEDVANDRLYDVFIKNIEPVKNYITPIRKTSVDASKDFLDKSLSFVFIDACHSYECVKEDLESWFPKIKSGGILAGHDAWAQQIARAVKEFAEERNLKYNIGYTWEINL